MALVRTSREGNLYCLRFLLPHMESLHPLLSQEQHPHKECPSLELSLHSHGIARELHAVTSYTGVMGNSEDIRNEQMLVALTKTVLFPHNKHTRVFGLSFRSVDNCSQSSHLRVSLLLSATPLDWEECSMFRNRTPVGPKKLVTATHHKN